MNNYISIYIKSKDLYARYINNANNSVREILFNEPQLTTNYNHNEITLHPKEND